MGQLVTAVVAIVLGVGGVMVLFWLLNAGVNRLPDVWKQRLRPWVFIGPAMLVVGLFLVLPLLDTVRRSFIVDGEFGFGNYAYLFQANTLSVIWNTVLWIVLVPVVAVAVGLAVAVLADKLRPRWE